MFINMSYLLFLITIKMVF